MKYKTFETERLFIQPTTIDDASFILELLNTPKWLQFIGDRNVHTLEDAQRYIETRMLPQLERTGFSNNTVIRKSDGMKIGVCGLYDREGVDGLDIGFAFLPEYEGQGYGYETNKRLMEAAKFDFGIHKINALTAIDNVNSQKLLEKLGLRFVDKVTLPNDVEEMFLYRN